MPAPAAGPYVQGGDPAGAEQESHKLLLVLILAGLVWGLWLLISKPSEPA